MWGQIPPHFANGKVELGIDIDYRKPWTTNFEHLFEGDEGDGEGQPPSLGVIGVVWGGVT